MRFVYDDPYTPRNAVEQLGGQLPIATRRECDLPIPVDSKLTRRKARTK